MKYQVKSSTTISKDAEHVKKFVADFKEWEKWSPWTITDPGIKMSYEGSPGQVGHKMSWEGEINGIGTQELIGQNGGTFTYDLRFMKPWKSQADVTIELSDQGGQTEVTWTMDSKMPLFLFFLIPMMRVMIKMDFDRGLRMLKEIAEKGEIDVETTNNGIRPVEGFSYVGLQRSVTMDEMRLQAPEDFKRIMKDLEGIGKRAQHWVMLYPKFNMVKGTLTYIAAISDEQLQDGDLGGDYVKGKVASGDALEISHRGSFDFIGNAWSMGMMYVRAKKIKTGIPYEYYHNNPMNTAERDLRTSIIFPVK